MQLVIEIPENRYDEIHSLKFAMYGLQSEENKQLFYWLINAVQDGRPLPKGHGRLIDADELRIKSIDVNAEFGNEWWCVDCDDIELAPTVLEADKEI